MAQKSDARVTRRDFLAVTLSRYFYVTPALYYCNNSSKIIINRIIKITVYIIDTRRWVKLRFQFTAVQMCITRVKSQKEK